jgi:hypothetical protein
MQSMKSMKGMKSSMNSNHQQETQEAKETNGTNAKDNTDNGLEIRQKERAGAIDLILKRMASTCSNEGAVGMGNGEIDMNVWQTARELCASTPTVNGCRSVTLPTSSTSTTETRSAASTTTYVQN